MSNCKKEKLYNITKLSKKEGTPGYISTIRIIHIKACNKKRESWNTN